MADRQGERPLGIAGRRAVPPGGVERTARGWWAEQDSNLRRLSQQIYSLPPLAAWVSAHLNPSSADLRGRATQLGLKVVAGESVRTLVLALH